MPTADAQKLFEEMRRIVHSTRPHAQSLMSLAIQFPEEPLTVDEQIEIAAQTGERRRVLKAQVNLVLANQQREQELEG